MTEMAATSGLLPLHPSIRLPVVRNLWTAAAAAAAILLRLVVVTQLMSATIASSGYNVLLFPVPGKSHVFSMGAMAVELANRGHRASLLVSRHLSLHSPELDRPGITVVRYEDSEPDNPIDYDLTMENMTLMTLEKKQNFFKMMPRMKILTERHCRYVTTKNEEVLEKLENQKFDLVVIDGIFFLKCMYLVPHRLRVPFITYSDAVDPLKIRTPWLPSFVPHILMSFTDQMSFPERLLNFLVTFLWPENYMFPDPPNDVLNGYRKYGDFANLDEIMSRSQMWLLAKDQVLEYPKPMMPNMVNVGGLTVQRTVGELPKEYKEYIDGAENGVILVTFGSMVSSFPAEMILRFASAFERLDGYRVIWRLKNRENISLPSNIKVAGWMPQNDILAHPKTKLFITHCGNNGQFEAVYHAVPMIGFPLMGDQEHNAKRLGNKGYGISMSLYTFTGDELLENIHKVIGEPSYKQRVSKASEIFHSNPQLPAERAAYWIEHVSRFGADHLRSASSDMPLYAYWMLDILGVLLLAISAVLFIVVKLVRLALGKLRGNPAESGHRRTKKDKTQ